MEDELKVRINAAHALIKYGGAVMADKFLAKHGDTLLAAVRAHESPKLLVKDCTVLESEGRKGPMIIADDSEARDANYLRAKDGEIVGLFISDDPDRMLAAVRLAEARDSAMRCDAALSRHCQNSDYSEEWYDERTILRRAQRRAHKQAGEALKAYRAAKEAK